MLLKIDSHVNKCAHILSALDDMFARGSRTAPCMLKNVILVELVQIANMHVNRETPSEWMSFHFPNTYVMYYIERAH